MEITPSRRILRLHHPERGLHLKGPRSHHSLCPPARSSLPFLLVIPLLHLASPQAAVSAPPVLDTPPLYSTSALRRASSCGSCVTRLSTEQFCVPRCSPPNSPSCKARLRSHAISARLILSRFFGTCVEPSHFEPDHFVSAFDVVASLQRSALEQFTCFITRCSVFCFAKLASATIRSVSAVLPSLRCSASESFSALNSWIPHLLHPRPTPFLRCKARHRNHSMSPRSYRRLRLCSLSPFRFIRLAVHPGLNPWMPATTLSNSSLKRLSPSSTCSLRYRAQRHRKFAFLAIHCALLCPQTSSFATIDPGTDVLPSPQLLDIGVALCVAALGTAATPRARFPVEDCGFALDRHLAFLSGFAPTCLAAYPGLNPWLHAPASSTMSLNISSRSSTPSLRCNASPNHDPGPLSSLHRSSQRPRHVVATLPPTTIRARCRPCTAALSVGTALRVRFLAEDCGFVLDRRLVLFAWQRIQA